MPTASSASAASRRRRTSAHSPSARLAPFRESLPSPSDLVDRRERLALRRLTLHVGREDALHLVEVRHEPVDLDRPDVVARLAGDLVQDVRPVVEHAAELLEEHRGVEEREVLALRIPTQPSSRELLHGRRRVRLEKRARLAAKVVLLGA